MGAEAKLTSVNGVEVRVRIRVEGHGCGSTSRSVQETVEEAMYEAAPDLTSLIVEGLDEPTEPVFISVDKLMGAASQSTSSLRTSPRGPSLRLDYLPWHESRHRSHTYRKR
jgi:hypothetical protein